MDAYTLSAADIRSVGLSDYATRSLLCDPSLIFELEYGPKGGGGTRRYSLRHLLPLLRQLRKFTANMEKTLAALDKQRRAKGSK